METQNNQICTGLLQNCIAAAQAEKKISHAKNKLPEIVIGIANKSEAKPWSVFGENYWL